MDITQCHIPPNTGTSNIEPDDRTDTRLYYKGSNKYLLAARLSLTRLWKTSQTWSIENTLELVNLHYGYELMMASSKGMKVKAQKYWHPWSQWNRVSLFL